MSSDSLIQPRSLNQITQSLGFDLQRVAEFYNLLAWFRGRVEVVITPATSIIASANGTNVIEPPTADDEWEVMSVFAYDTAAIDVADRIAFGYRDQKTAVVIPLQDTQMGISSFGTNGVLFPNRQVAVATDRPWIATPDHAGEGWIVRLTDNKVSDKQLLAKLTATATVGTRLFQTAAIIHRRRVT